MFEGWKTQLFVTSMISPENILDCLSRRLIPLGYSIRSNILNFSSYGVPHHRERLITIGCRIPQVLESCPPVENVFSKQISPFHPVPLLMGTKMAMLLVNLRDAIGRLPQLDSLGLLQDSKDLTIVFRVGMKISISG